MRNRKITFEGEFQPVKWSCRAPLPSGKLCPRRDRVKVSTCVCHRVIWCVTMSVQCPFHGLIIARDEQGQPVDSNSSVDGQQSKRLLCYYNCHSETPPATASVDNVSWEDIEEEVSEATGTN